MFLRLAVLVSIPFFSAGSAGPAPKPEARAAWARSVSDPRWVIGQVTVGSSPTRVLDVLNEVDDWPTIFTDLTSLNVLKHDGSYWHISATSRILDCGEFEAHVVFVRSDQVTIALDVPDVQGNWQLTIRRGPQEGMSDLTVGLFLVPEKDEEGWYGTSDDLRRRQERLMERYLTDLEDALNPIPPGVI
jgi:hypothetical protein